MRKLYYYTDDSMKELKGEIDLHACRKVCSIGAFSGDVVADSVRCPLISQVLVKLSHPKYNHVLSCVCEHREFFLSADSEEGMMSWAETIASLWAAQKRGATAPVAVEVAPAPATVLPATQDSQRGLAEMDENDNDPDDYDDDETNGQSAGPSAPPPPPPTEPALEASPSSGDGAIDNGMDDCNGDDELFAFIDRANSVSSRPRSILLDFKFPPPPPTDPPPDARAPGEAPSTCEVRKLLYDFEADGDGSKVTARAGEKAEVLQVRVSQRVI